MARNAALYILALTTFNFNLLKGRETFLSIFSEKIVWKVSKKTSGDLRICTGHVWRGIKDQRHAAGGDKSMCHRWQIIRCVQGKCIKDSSLVHVAWEET